MLSANAGMWKRVPNTYGDKCLFYCEHGYKAVSGTKERQCLENGTWSGSPLTCTGEFSIVTVSQGPILTL